METGEQEGGDRKRLHWRLLGWAAVAEAFGCYHCLWHWSPLKLHKPLWCQDQNPTHAASLLPYLRGGSWAEERDGCSC